MTPRILTLALALLTAAAVATPAGLALAQEPVARGHSKTEFLKTYDTNLDGKVSKAEYDAKRQADYGRTDADKDGAVTEAEYVGEYTVRLDAELAATRKRSLDQAKVRFGVIDADKSGKMSAAEYAGVATKTFTALDTNGDGVVDDADTAKAH